jgi:hypothetical protein
MEARSQIITEITKLDERYLGLLYKIIRQFPHAQEGRGEKMPEQQVAEILQEIADAGGLEIDSPQTWQHEVRSDRLLPFREN